jgi:hypothetical protein
MWRVVGVLALTSVVLTGCNSFDYKGPQGTSPKANEVVAKMTFDAAWDRLIDHASKTFFSIENFEKQSGLLTLSFGADQASRFIDCGHVDARTGGATFSGPYADYVTRQLGGSLTGKMNLLVQRVSATETKIRVNARYMLYAPASIQPYATQPATTWAFDTGGASTQAVANPLNPSAPTRSCIPTGAAEAEILKAFE